MVASITSDEANAIGKMLDAYFPDDNRMLNLLVNFSDKDIECKKIIRTRFEDIVNMQGVVHTLTFVMPVSANAFIAIETFVKMMKTTKMNLIKLIFVERKSDKVEEWIRSDLPIFHGMGIYNVFDCSANEHLCRIEWTLL